MASVYLLDELSKILDDQFYGDVGICAMLIIKVDVVGAQFVQGGS